LDGAATSEAEPLPSSDDRHGSVVLQIGGDETRLIMAPLHKHVKAKMM